MRTKSRLLSLVLCAFAAVSAWAAVPFTPTTIENGEFAAGTQWYTMQLGGMYITDNGDAEKITLLGHATTKLEASDLWCFVMNGTKGYKIYNKQAGAGKVLASSTKMGALAGYVGTGGSTYPTLQDEATLPTGYSDVWSFEDSDTAEDCQYIILNGANAALNNFGNVGDLAFWAEGKDANSSVLIEFAETEVEIKGSTGQFTSSNANKTWHAVWASSQMEGFTLSTGVNNMTTEGDYIAGYSGLTQSSTYTLTAPEGYAVAGYSFDFANTGSDASYSLKLTAEGNSYQSSTEWQSVKVEGLTERVATFLQEGANKGITLKNFVVKIQRSTVAPETQYNVFESYPNQVPYRIPAIAQAKNGTLIAVADYRYSGGDIGSGALDLRYSLSRDNGETWEPYKTLVSCNYNAGGNLHTGYGDPCIVADRESDRVLALSCSGNNMFPNGTRTHHQGIARYYSEDNGETWSNPTDISETIYAMFDNCKIGSASSMFVGSGRICQSYTVKVDQYYRLYCSVLFKDVYGTNKNYVLYSDDFGDTWDVLGGVDVAPIPSGADEPKAEELPDGSIICSSRVGSGRYFNIFSFTDSKKAEGSWGTVAFSGKSNNGLTASSNACNGEVLCVPVIRTEDNKPMYLFLQSVPFGPGNRSNVGINYKALENIADFNTPENIAKDWDGKYQSSYMGSAYSTWTWLANNTLAFLYEESTFGKDYTIVYKNYTIEQLTKGAYTYNAEADRHAFLAESVDMRADELEFEQHNYVGGITVSEEGKAAVVKAIETYKATPSNENYEAINAAVKAALGNAAVRTVRPYDWYRLLNVGRAGELYLAPEATRFTAEAANTTDADQLFCFLPANDEGTQFYLYNGNYDLYLGPLGQNETQPAVMASENGAGIWSFIYRPNGQSSVVCDNKTGGHAGLHLAGDMDRLVPWTTDSEASLWYIEKVETYSVTIPEAGYTTISLPFPVSLPEGVKAYRAVGEVVVNGVPCLRIEETDNVVLAPVVLAGEAGKYELPVINLLDALMPTADEEEEIYFDGTLKAANVSGSIYQLKGAEFVKRSGTTGSVAANTAYYVSDNEAATLPLTEKEGTPDGIESIENAQKAVKFYDLNGRQVQKPLKGIYVTSEGMKVLVK